MTATAITPTDTPTCPSWCTSHRSGGEQGTVFHTSTVGTVQGFAERRDRTDAEPHNLNVRLERFESWDATARTITLHDSEIVVTTDDGEMHFEVVNPEHARALARLLVAAADRM